MAKVSVIVPNYNHARFLRQRIDSILAQTFQNFELILLDDCSTDDSRSVLSAYASDPRVRLIFNDANSGSPFKQWNKGVRLARGEYIWIAESDDYAHAHLLERLVSLMDTDPRMTFAYCRSKRVYVDNEFGGFADSHMAPIDPQRWTADYVADGREECRIYFVRHNPVPNASAVVFRKSTYEQIGGADENLSVCGDWKLWAAMALQGRIAYIGEPLNYFRFHDGSVRNKTSRANVDVIEHLQVIRWLLDQVTPPPKVLDNVGQLVASMWVPAIMSFRVPRDVKRTILRRVREIDPHPLRNAIGPGLRTIRRKIARHWREFAPAPTPFLGNTHSEKENGINTSESMR
jgi:glycosyltransferase involved in cell wall biosynthesis